MAEGFDRIVIAVPDLAQASSELATLLSIQGRPIPGDGGRPSAGFPLANTLLELRERPTEQVFIEGLVLCDTAAADLPARLENPLGLGIEACNGKGTAALRDTVPALSVDHLVLRTNDADACVDFFTGQQGIRLALDKTVPQWGGRMLFFRAGKMTLEVIYAQDDPPAQNFFWGIAFQHPDIEALVAAMTSRGVRCSEVRDGRKPGTRVATVKSHCLGIPALLVEPASDRADAAS